MLKMIALKIFKSRMPSTVQNLVIIFARMINHDANKVVDFLNTFSVENRIAIKAVLNKWLLH